ncbi:Cation/acetate symporter ActP [compost metagenome]
MGLLSAVVLTILSQAVWVDVFHFKSAPFPYTSPALFSMTIGFLGIWIVSVTDKSARARLDKAGFEAQELRSETGIGAVEAAGH